MILTALAVPMLGAADAQAQVLAWEDNGFVNIGIGAQAGSNDFTRSLSFPLFGETASVDEQQPVGGGALFDVSGGARVWRNLGVGIGFTRYSDSADATLRGAAPHPLFFNSPRTVTGTAGGLDRTESAVHFFGLWTVVVTDRIDVMFSGGPSIFNVTQDVVTAVTVLEGGPPFDVVAGITTTASEVDDTGVGFNVGADVTYRFTDMLGAGLFLRYARASVDLAGVGSADAGGTHVGVGLRVRF